MDTVPIISANDKNGHFFSLVQLNAIASSSVRNKLKHVEYKEVKIEFDTN